MRPHEILAETSHRPWKIAALPWRYYQEWNEALFLHWEVSQELLRSLIPPTLELDLFLGKAWISLVAFSMEKLRVNGLPAVRSISDFHEINVRTYVIRDGKAGVYFLSMEGEKQLAVFIAKKISGLPYTKASIKRSQAEGGREYSSDNKIQGFSFKVLYETNKLFYERTSLDKWLIERYCLYFEKSSRLFRYDIHHFEWKIEAVNILELKLRYQIGRIFLSEKQPDLCHFSPGVKVLAWPRISVP